MGSSNFLTALTGNRLYPITDRRLSGLSHAEQVLQLAEAGASLIQLREKFLSPLDFYREAEAAVRVARQHGAKIIINDRVDIALALKADGVHLGQDDLPPAAARRILGPDTIIGFSTHDPNQARLATDLPVDYIAIGPVFTTETKQTFDPSVGLAGVRLAREAVGSIPLVAIGGISFANNLEVLGAGVDAVAIIRDIWSPAPNSVAKFNLLRSQH